MTIGVDLEPPPRAVKLWSHEWMSWLFNLYKYVRANASGTWTSSVLTPASYEEVAIAHGLGTDDIDFGFSVSNDLSGASQYTYNAMMSGFNGQTITDADTSGRSSLATQMNTLSISAGELGLSVQNSAGSNASITVNWWARVR